MGDSNLHNHKRVPFFIAWRADGGFRAVGLKAPNRTQFANVMLSSLHALGSDEVASFGDSTAPFDLAGETPPRGA